MVVWYGWSRQDQCGQNRRGPAHSTLLPPPGPACFDCWWPASSWLVPLPTRGKEDAPGLRPPLGKRWAGRAPGGCIVDPLQGHSGIHTAALLCTAGLQSHPVAIVSGPTMAPGSHYYSHTPNLSAQYGPVLVSCDTAMQCSLVGARPGEHPRR